MIAMWRFAVRHTCVCFARPMTPDVRSRSSPFHQSQKPVSAVPSDTIRPTTVTKVPATKKSLAASEPSSVRNEITSKTAART
jgi:hypothetical protein